MKNMMQKAANLNARLVLVENDSSREQDKERVSPDFENLHEAEREILIKQIHGKQLEALSNAKEA